MKVELPEFYIALVLAESSKGEPNQDHLEALRLATIDYLLRHLQPNYPTLTRLELYFTSFQCGSQKPQPRFQVYWEVHAIAHLKKKSKNSPNAEQLFESVGKAFDREFLLQTVRSAEANSPLASAVEVQVNRVKRQTAGGAVKAPPFYIGFVCENEPVSKPTDEEKNRMLQHVHQEAVKQLKRDYSDNFQDLTLKIVKIDIGKRAGKPDKRFNIYVEFEAVATFVNDLPESTDFFRVLSTCSSTQFIVGFVNIGGPFVGVYELAIHVCAWILVPEEEEADDGEGEGEAEEEEEGIVVIVIQFWIALVVSELQKIPAKNQLDDFDKLNNEFFFALFAALYKDKFVDMVLEPDSSQKFDAGLPLPRFNMLQGYQATLQFQSPAPKPAQVLSNIVQCDVQTLLSQIFGLSAPWDKTTEAALGSVANREPPIKQVYGGKIELGEEAPPETKKTRAPNKAGNNVEKKHKNKVEKKCKQPQKAECHLPATPPENPKAQPVVATKPAGGGIVNVGTSDVFVAFTIHDCDSAPEDEDFRVLVQATNNFYTAHLQKVFGDKFKQVDVSIRQALFNSGKPHKHYNVYVEWDISARFADDANAPDRHTLCRSLVDYINALDYLKSVRTLSQTPFSRGIGIYTQQVNS